MSDIKQINIHIVQLVKDMCDKINESNSSLVKRKALKEFIDNAGAVDGTTIHWVLNWVYDQNVKFGITSTNVKKYMETHNQNGPAESIHYVLLDLRDGKLTGHAACQAVMNLAAELPEELVPTFFNILDKNLKIRMDAKSINKVIPDLIPVFEVSLCNVYAERKHTVNFEKDQWFASRKLDGCRLITIVQPNDIKFYSRQGKEFNTLNKLADSIRMFFPIAEALDCMGGEGFVIDGEICILDDNNNEDFKSIMKEITRKNHTIDRPMYMVYDMIPLEDFNMGTTGMTFSKRNKILEDMVGKYVANIFDWNDPVKESMIEWVLQVHVDDEKQLNHMFEIARDLGWEGLVIRKDDTTICKRSDSMLKIKAFKDSEYVVEGVEIGPFRVIVNGKEVEEDVMTNAYITHKGNRVSVGSGWSLEQRRQYKEHPEDIVGKTITVQYFEETTDKDGNASLRFPTCKVVYENGRNV